MAATRDRELFERVLRHYSGGSMTCARCGRTDDLSIDHHVPRSLNPNQGLKRDVGKPLWSRLVREGFPGGYSVLCRVCNASKPEELPTRTDDSGRLEFPIQRRRLNKTSRKFELKIEWLGHGERGYSEELSRRKDPEFGSPLPAALAGKRVGYEMMDLKIAFEVETGARLPMRVSRYHHGPPGVAWTQTLQEFAALWPETREFRSEPIQSGPTGWDDLGRGEFRCRRCAAGKGSFNRVRTEERKREHRCGRLIRPEVTAARLALADPAWKSQIFEFVLGKLAAESKRP
jgi:hypothetical protein